MKIYPIVPGRGLVTPNSTKERLNYLDENGLSTDEIRSTSLNLQHVQKNIESFIGSVELPLGLVGPLEYHHAGETELVYTAVATLEGALVASMNRGSKAISRSGGFTARVIHQKMVRCPLFLFDDPAAADEFVIWIKENEQLIRQEAEQHSNHAKLLQVDPVILNNAVHLFFEYSTGDASGQNMTTTCTWHAILWINQAFTAQTGLPVKKFLIEGNGSSDKKVSLGNITRGRGISVTAKCVLMEEVINRDLRTNSEDLIESYKQAVEIAEKIGMIRFNVNISNAIAAIFASTGQDLGCVHESAVGNFLVKKVSGGLEIELNLSNLVIGTIGGGTHLPKQREVLDIMGCYGNGKVQRFAELIAGFTMALEISTHSAIAGGQFAKAHEKLGRNKPINWLTRSELNLEFLMHCLPEFMKNNKVEDIHLMRSQLFENGIIINLTHKINRKLTGFLPIELSCHETIMQILLKSKPSDEDVINGLHLMASSVNAELATLLFKNRQYLEYTNCHLKELEMNLALNSAGFDIMPEVYGTYVDQDRAIFLLFTELLDHEQMTIINSENAPQLWTKAHILTAIEGISRIHRHFEKYSKDIPEIVPEFEPWKAAELYHKFFEIIKEDYRDSPWIIELDEVHEWIRNLKTDHDALKIPSTCIHHDFNSRNIAIRGDSSLCAYDWELAVRHFPHRDIVELLSFTLPEGFEEWQFTEYLKYHQQFYPEQDSGQWMRCYEYCLKEYIITRLSFYLTGRIVLDFAFTERVISNALNMLKILNKK